MCKVISCKTLFYLGRAITTYDHPLPQRYWLFMHSNWLPEQRFDTVHIKQFVNTTLYAHTTHKWRYDTKCEIWHYIIGLTDYNLPYRTYEQQGNACSYSPSSPHTCHKHSGSDHLSGSSYSSSHMHFSCIEAVVFLRINIKSNCIAWIDSDELHSVLRLIIFSNIMQNVM